MQKYLTLVLLLLSLLFASSARADIPATQPADPSKIKLLIVTGGHPFAKTFFNQFDNLPFITYTHAEEGDFKTGNATAYDRPDLASFDAILLYDFQLNMTPDQRKNFLALFDKGVGLLVLHHALLSYQDWPEFKRIAGASYRLDTSVEDGKTIPESLYKGDVDMDVTVTDKSSPLAAGISDFHMKDELYTRYPTTADIHVVLTTHDEPIAWTRIEKNSNIATIVIGHGPGTWDNPNFQKLLTNALHFVAKK